MNESFCRSFQTTPITLLATTLPSHYQPIHTSRQHALWQDQIDCGTVMRSWWCISKKSSSIQKKSYLWRVYQSSTNLLNVLRCDSFVTMFFCTISKFFSHSKSFISTSITLKWLSAIDIYKCLIGNYFVTI